MPRTQTISTTESSAEALAAIEVHVGNIVRRCDDFLANQPRRERLNSAVLAAHRPEPAKKMSIADAVKRAHEELGC